MRIKGLCVLLCLLLALPVAQAEEETVIAPLRETPEAIVKLLDTARNELGYTEEKGGVTKYGVWAGESDAEWCAEYLCWCVDQTDKHEGTTLLNRQYPYYTSSNTGRDWFLKQGRYVARKGFVPGWGSQWFRGAEAVMAANAYVPQPGDWVFFSNVASGDTTHVAMVEYCTRNENGQVQVHVLEGNNPDTVARNVYDLDHWAILGYGTVDEQAEITLRFGSEGVKVKALQEELVKAGFMESQYTTGRFGSITESAVKAFQQSHDLPVTGIADFAFRQTLNAVIAEK